VALSVIALSTACHKVSDPHSKDASIASPSPLRKSEYAVTLKPSTTLVDAQTMARAHRGAASD
jgi:hypothetical protein